MKRCRRGIASSVMAESPPIIPITDKFIKNSISLLRRNKRVNIRGNYIYNNEGKIKALIKRLAQRTHHMTLPQWSPTQGACSLATRWQNFYFYLLYI